MDVDEVYLIDLPQWEDSITGLGFEKEINYNTLEWKILPSPGIKPSGIP
ncbi:18580_t:CDS:1, partial [Gigaspora rosea]